MVGVPIRTCVSALLGMSRERMTKTHEESPKPRGAVGQTSPQVPFSLAPTQIHLRQQHYKHD